jgi:O-antigen/teichoic acid export membrane protein
MNSTIRNIFYVFTASTLSKVFGAVTSIILPKLLDPGNYGVWVTLLLIVSYAPIAALGTVEALLRQYPYYIGKGELKKARACEENVLGSIFITAIFLIICSVSAHIIVANTTFEAYRQEVMMMFMTAAISCCSGYFYFRYAAHHKFKAYSIIDTLRAIITLLLVSVFAYLWSLKGAVLGYLITEIIVCAVSAMLSIRMCGSVKIRFNRNEIWKAIKIGFPITIVIWTLTLQSSVDRLVSVSFLGKEMTGYYGLGGSFVSMLVLIPSAVTRVLYPKINEGIGKNQNAKQLSSLIISPVRILSILIPVLIGSLMILLPTIYEVVFPKYLPGTQSAQLLLLGFFFVGLIGNGVNYLISKNKQNILLGFVIISLTTNALLSIYFISLGLNIIGVALSTGIAGALLVSLIWILVLKYLEYSTADQWRGLIGLYSPFILMLSIIFIYYFIFPMYLNSTGIVAFIYMLIFTLTYLIIIYLMPPYNRWCKEIYYLFKHHMHVMPVLSESKTVK